MYVHYFFQGKAGHRVLTVGETLNPFTFFQFEAIHLFAINELKSMKVLSASLKL